MHVCACVCEHMFARVCTFECVCMFVCVCVCLCVSVVAQENAVCVHTMKYCH